MTVNTKWCFSKAKTDGPEVFSYNDVGPIKYLEDPVDPGREAVDALGSLQENISVLVLPPCSVKTIQDLAAELPCLNHIIIVDTNEERLNAWHDGVSKCRFQNMSSMVLTTNINADKDVLLKILEPFPIAVHLWKIYHYVPRRFKRVDRIIDTYIQALLQFTKQKVSLTLNYQSGEAWHHIVNQMATLQDQSIRNFIIEPQNKKRAFVVAGAGPSLDENIEVLKKYRDQVVILACERSIGTFKQHNIKPDYVVSVENIILMWRHYEYHLDFLKDIPLIAPYMVSHVVARNYPGDLISVKIEGNDEWLGTFGGELASDVGNCVGHYAYHLATIFNPSKIILIGNDLAMRDGRTHTCSTHSDIDKKKGVIVTKGYYGGEVETTSTFFHYIQRFETYFRNAPCPVINATEGGAYLSGAEHIPLDDALKQLPKISRLPYVELEQNEVQKFYEDKIGAIRALRKRLVESEADVDAIDKDKPKPFFEFIEDSLQVLLNHFLQPKLYLHYYDILQNYLPKRYENYKLIVTKLIEESIDACDFILSLDKACKFNGAGDTQNCLVLTPTGADSSWVKERYSQCNFFDMEALSHLPDIWHTIVENNIGTVIAFDAQVIPDTWSIPKIQCLDIKSKEKNHGMLYRTPGYQISARDEEVMDTWNWDEVILKRFKRMTVDEYFQANVLHN